MVEQSTNAGNPNDFSRYCRHIAGAKHGAIVDALVGAFVIEVGLKFREP
jgi:hypothetical protein